VTSIASLTSSFTENVNVYESSLCTTFILLSSISGGFESIVKVTSSEDILVPEIEALTLCSPSDQSLFLSNSHESELVVSVVPTSFPLSDIF
jgi:hypothetical protein